MIRNRYIDEPIASYRWQWVVVTEMNLRISWVQYLRRIEAVIREWETTVRLLDYICCISHGEPMRSAHFWNYSLWKMIGDRSLTRTSQYEEDLIASNLAKDSWALGNEASSGKSVIFWHLNGPPRCRQLAVRCWCWWPRENRNVPKTLTAEMMRIMIAIFGRSLLPLLGSVRFKLKTRMLITVSSTSIVLYCHQISTGAINLICKRISSSEAKID